MMPSTPARPGAPLPSDRSPSRWTPSGPGAGHGASAPGSPGNGAASPRHSPARRRGGWAAGSGIPPRSRVQPGASCCRACAGNRCAWRSPLSGRATPARRSMPPTGGRGGGAGRIRCPSPRTGTAWPGRTALPPRAGRECTPGCASPVCCGARPARPAAPGCSGAPCRVRRWCGSRADRAPRSGARRTGARPAPLRGRRRPGPPGNRPGCFPGPRRGAAWPTMVGMPRVMTLLCFARTPADSPGIVRGRPGRINRATAIVMEESCCAC